jgi:hypothetical protein
VVGRAEADRVSFRGLLEGRSLFDTLNEVHWMTLEELKVVL